MCFNAENNCNSIGTKNMTISLKELLKYYFNFKSELKDEIHELMSKKPYLWKNRPLSDKLIYYAGCDVKYLPKVYEIICKKCDKGIYNNIKTNNIFEECNKYLKYLEINKEVKNFNRTDLSKGKKLSGLIKNYQHKCVFIQLNIGYMGIVTEGDSISKLKEKYKLGDITDFIVQEVEEKKKRLVLSLFIEKNNNNLRENLKAIIKKKEKEEKQKKNEIGNKLSHESLNINKKSFYPKNYINNKYYTINTDVNNIQMINKNNYFNYNNINTIGNKTFSGHFYFNNFTQPNLVNNGFLYNNEDNAYYFDPPDENNSSNFYYVINKYQDNYSNKHFHQ